MVYIFIFFGIFRLPGLRLLETRVFVSLGFEVFRAKTNSAFGISSSEVFRGNRQGDYIYTLFMCMFISFMSGPCPPMFVGHVKLRTSAH